MQSTRRFIAAATIFALPVCTHAGFIKVSDFNDAQTGNINGQQGFVSINDGTVPAFQVMADPDSPSNQVLRSKGVTAGAERLIYHSAQTTIAQGSQGTFFTRFRYTGTGDMNFGLSDIASPGTNFNAFEVQFGASNVNTTNGTFNLSARDGSAGQRALDGSLSLNSWYSLWALIDNTTDTYSVFIDGAGFSGPTKLSSITVPGLSDFKFRNSGTSLQSTDLSTVLIRRHEYFLDDIYINTTSYDLSSPISAALYVPEPAYSALLLSGSFLLKRRTLRS